MHIGKHKSNTLKRLEPIHKFNGGIGATLCHNCRVIINTGFSDKLYCIDCGPNKVAYHNRYRDKIIFEHIGNEVIMTGGSWFRFGWPNVYDKAYEAFISEHAEHGMELIDFEKFKEEVHNYKNEAMRPYSQLVYSNNNVINFVDPSGGPYISLGNNLKEFWPEGQYQDLIIESIQFKKEEPKDKEDYKSTIVFKIKK